MPTRVLAFESDAQFARELETQFRALGCEVTVVDDVNQGLQAASVNKPDLILLTIELPRMSGYSVCNRIKRDADLKEIPLIILSSESTDQTFEQHKRLGTRAQDYVRKPVTFSRLLERVRKFVTLSANVSISPDDDGIVIDDEIELTEDSLISSAPSKGSVSPPSHRPIDADIDDFAEHAFGVMLDVPASTKPSQRPSARLDSQNASSNLPSVIPSSPRVPTGLSPVGQAHGGSADLERIQEEIRRTKVQLEEKERLLAEAQGELKELKRSSRSSMADSAETENLRRELQEVKSKLNVSVKPPGGPSAREFLDLREQLNKKDKELLDLRDQLTHKDKDLLNVRDSSLSLEREKADLSDKVEELARSLSEVQKIADAAKNDKEAAAKRAEDHKRKVEKLTGQLEEKAAELEKLAARRTADLAERDAEKARILSEHGSALEAARAERDAEKTRILSEHSAALEAARAEFIRSISEAEQEGRAALEQAVAEARSAADTHESQALEAERQAATERLNSALAELEQRLRGEFAEDKAAVLGQLQSEKANSERQRDERIAMLEANIDQLRGELEQANGRVSDREQNIANLEASLHGARGDLEQSNRTLEIRDERISTLEAELAHQRNETLTTLESLSAERQRLAQALDKWNEDQASLERIKDALAAALVQVESIEERTLE